MCVFFEIDVASTERSARRPAAAEFLGPHDMLSICTGIRENMQTIFPVGAGGHKMRNWPWSKRKAFGFLFLEGWIGVVRP